jgi:hypothetical protein
MSRAARQAPVASELEYVIDTDASPIDLRQLDDALAALLLDMVEEEERQEAKASA